MAKPIRVDIVSAAEAVWSGEAVQVSARTQIGEIGILAGLLLSACAAHRETVSTPCCRSCTPCG